MHRPATTALLVAVTLLGAACSPQTTTTTTATTAPPATTTTVASTTTTAAPTVVLALSDQTVGALQVTVDVENTIPVTLTVSDTDGPLGESETLEPGAHTGVTVGLNRPAWEPKPLEQDVAKQLTVDAVDENGATVASASAAITLHTPVSDYTVPNPPTD